MTLAPIIEKITGKGQSSKFNNGPSIPDIKNESPARNFNNMPQVSNNTLNQSMINPVNMSSDSQFFNEMLSEFNKYSPFDNISDVDPKEKSETKSEAGVSFFEHDLSDI